MQLKQAFFVPAHGLHFFEHLYVFYGFGIHAAEYRYPLSALRQHHPANLGSIDPDANPLLEMGVICFYLQQQLTAGYV
ncbi:hypothetical protein D3C85_1826810 [compost metagenome]